jgi:hypothetical protein
MRKLTIQGQAIAGWTSAIPLWLLSRTARRSGARRRPGPVASAMGTTGRRTYRRRRASARRTMAVATATAMIATPPKGRPIGRNEAPAAVISI